MPQVSFVGEIKEISVDSPSDELSVTFAIVPGNITWQLRSGENHGETCVCVRDSVTGVAGFNHPIEALYDTSTAEGWPMIILEVWSKDALNHRQLIGCGMLHIFCLPFRYSIFTEFVLGNVWLPTSIERNNVIDIPIWIPILNNSRFLFKGKLL